MISQHFQTPLHIPNTSTQACQHSVLQKSEHWNIIGHLEVAAQEALRALLRDLVGDNIEPIEPVELDHVCQLTGPGGRRRGGARGVRRCVEAIETYLTNQR